MEEPKKIQPKGLADYLDVLTRAVFQAGFSWAVVERKWDGFRDAFHGFDPEAVALFDPADVDRLACDRRIIRNRAKIEATVHNAATLLELDTEHGSFPRYLRSHVDFEATAADLVRRFRYLGDLGAYYFLWVVNEPVPSYEEWCRRRGVEPKAT